MTPVFVMIYDAGVRKTLESEPPAPTSSSPSRQAMLKLMLIAQLVCSLVAPYVVTRATKTTPPDRRSRLNQRIFQAPAHATSQARGPSGPRSGPRRAMATEQSRSSGSHRLDESSHLSAAIGHLAPGGASETDGGSLPGSNANLSASDLHG